MKRKVLFWCGNRAFDAIPRNEDGSVDVEKMADRVVAARLFFFGRGNQSWDKISEEPRRKNRVMFSVESEVFRQWKAFARACCPHESGPHRDGNLSRLLRLAVLLHSRDAESAPVQSKSKKESVVFDVSCLHRVDFLFWGFRDRSGKSNQ